MVATWIEAAARGRQGGPVRAGMWAAVVVGTHPVEADQEVWLEISADDVPLGPLPAYWVENKGVNSLWHIPIPPQGVGARLRYRSAARRAGAEPVYSPHQDVMVRPNLPDRSAVPELVGSQPEGLIGNRMMTVRVDARGSTYDVYFPTVGLHSDVRPSEGDLPQSRAHFRGIIGGLAVGRRLDWFAEPLAWDATQRYQGATNLLVTELKWRHGPIRVLETDLVVMGSELPRTAGGGTESPGQYLKRFRVLNEGPEPRRALFGVYVRAEVNGGIGEPGLSWQDGDRALLASNRGHGHANRKLARDATIEFAVALDDDDDSYCEPTGPNEAILLRWLDLPANGSRNVDLLVSGAFTGWRGDLGTFEHWLRPALAWFREADLDRVEQETANQWDGFVEPLPELDFPKGRYAVSIRRSALAAALHADAKWGAIAGGFDRGLHAYCWPRDALWTGGALDRLGHVPIGRNVFEWLARVRGQNRPYAYWYQKYTIDGWPEWETPSIDQTALIPWALERHYRRTGDLEFVSGHWPMIEQAATVCLGESKHPGLSWIEELSLVSSGGIWDSRYGAFLYSNACIVVGLRSAVRLAELLGRPDPDGRWKGRAERIWEEGILRDAPEDGAGPGLFDPGLGRFLEARRLSKLYGLWTDRPDWRIERSAALDISLLGMAVPLGLLPASDVRVRAGAAALLRHNLVLGEAGVLTRWSPETSGTGPVVAPGLSHRRETSSLATLWMARYLLRLGRETGEGRHWSRGLALLDGMLARLGPLGLALRTSEEPGSGGNAAPGVWELHASLIEALLDVAGLDYDASRKVVLLEPILAPGWPHVGLSQAFRCGDVRYRLDRNDDGPVRRLALGARLEHPVTLEVDVTCPGLERIGFWQSHSDTPPPTFDRASRRVRWSVELPAGDSAWEWSWGALSPEEETRRALAPNLGVSTALG